MDHSAVQERESAERCDIWRGKPHAAADSALGIRVIAAERFDPSTVDAIVLSSQGYEEQMAATCAQRWPETSVYRVWRPVLEESFA